MHKLGYGIETYTDWGKSGHFKPGQGDRTVYLISEFEIAKDQALHIGLGKGFRDTDEWTVMKAVSSISF
jgi:hypothetical protein